jgi:hypothetical protein
MSKQLVNFIEFNGYNIPDTCCTERLKLEKENPHPRDKEIAFDEGPHTYYIQSVSDYTSGTTFIHHYFPEFDSEETATRMFNRKDFSTNDRYEKYRQYLIEDDGTKASREVVVKRIIKSWEDNGAVQSGLGTTMHRNIELYYNGIDTGDTSTEFGYFLEYDKVIKERKWTPFRTEMMVWDEESKVCGSIDMIYVEEKYLDDIPLWKKGEKILHIRLVDWKRSKKITTNGFKKTGFGLCSDMPDSNFFHYKIQLNLYRFILEKKYSIIVDSMAITICHPNQKTFQEITFSDEQVLVKKMLDENIRNVNRKRDNIDSCDLDSVSKKIKV